MTHRIGAKGQVVIPKAIRDRAGLHPGAEVEVSLEGDDVVLRQRTPGKSLRGRFAGGNMAAKLLEERAREPR